MLNPGSSRPLNSDKNNPFKNNIFNNYTKLETDNTMDVFIDVFSKLQKEKKYINGIIEIKNLFNYREGNLTNDDWLFITGNIKNNNNSLNTNINPIFNGNFVFFGWGTSKLVNQEIKNYAKNIFNKCVKDEKIILYISPKTEIESQKYLSFYHPLGGHWKKDKMLKFNESMYEIFNNLEAKINF